MANLFSKSRGGPTEKKQLLDLFKFIAESTRNAAAHSATVPHTLAQKIEKFEPGLIQMQSSTPDPAGNVIVSATQKGIEAIYGEGAAQSQQSGDGKKMFVIEKGFNLPPSKRGGVKEDVYPFAQMEVGDSFFVPATDDKPNPAKALASTVSSATKRYAAVYPEGHEKAGQTTGKDGRKFTVRARTAQDGEKSDGARVYRVA